MGKIAPIFIILKTRPAKKFLSDKRYHEIVKNLGFSNVEELFLALVP